MRIPDRGAVALSEFVRDLLQELEAFGIGFGDVQLLPLQARPVHLLEHVDGVHRCDALAAGQDGQAMLREKQSLVDSESICPKAFLIKLLWSAPPSWLRMPRQQIHLKWVSNKPSMLLQYASDERVVRRRRVHLVHLFDPDVLHEPASGGG